MKLKPTTGGNISAPKSRIWEIDFLRGFCVLLMIFDHIQYNFAVLFGGKSGLWATSPSYAGSAFERLSLNAIEYFETPLRNTAQPIVVMIFVFLAGISSSLSKSNVKRGLRIFIFACLLTAATALINIFIAGTTILFGVIHMLGIIIIFYGGLDLLLKRVIVDPREEGSTEVYKILSVLLLIGLGILLTLLGTVYTKENPYDGTGLGALFFYSRDFHKISADYFPLLPWAGVLLLGAVFGKLFYASKKGLLPDKTNDGLNKATLPVTFIGRKAVWFYLLHQVVVFGLLYIIGALAGMV